MWVEDIVYGLLIIGIGLGLGIFLFNITNRFTVSFAGQARSKSLGRVVQWLTVTLFVLLGGLVASGSTTASIALVVGALTFALTFGMQNVIQNFVAGLLMAIDGRIQMGQWVEIGGQPSQTGPAEVLDISLQKVKLREVGGRIYFIPNSYIFMNKLLNVSESGYLEVRVQISLPFQKDSEKVEQMLVEAAKESRFIFPQAKISARDMARRPSRMERMSGTIESALPSEKLLPVVRLVGASRDGVDYMASMWTPFPELRDEISSDYLRRSVAALDLANVKQ